MSVTVTPESRRAILADASATDGSPRALDAVASKHGLMLAELRDLIEKQPSVRPVPAPPPVSLASRADDIHALVHSAKEHPSKKVQAQANRCLAAISRLREVIREDESKNAETRKVAAERAEAKREVERLKAKLAEAQAKLRGGKASAPTGDAAAIRAWASEHGVDVPSRGRIPAQVREQYAAERAS